MILHLITETNEGQVLNMKSYKVNDGIAPKIELQNLIDSSVIAERAWNRKVEKELLANELIAEVKADAHRMCVHND